MQVIMISALHYHFHLDVYYITYPVHTNILYEIGESVSECV